MTKSSRRRETAWKKQFTTTNSERVCEECGGDVVISGNRCYICTVCGLEQSSTFCKSVEIFKEEALKNSDTD